MLMTLLSSSLVYFKGIFVSQLLSFFRLLSRDENYTICDLLKFQKVTDDSDVHCSQFGKYITVFTLSRLVAYLL